MTARSVSATAEAMIAGVTTAESRDTCPVSVLRDGQIGEGAVEEEEVVVEDPVTTAESLATCPGSVLTAVEAEVVEAAAAAAVVEAATGAVSLGILLETVPKAVALAVLVAAAAAAPRLDATAATNWATLPRLAPWSHER